QMNAGGILRRERVDYASSRNPRRGGRFYAWVALSAALIIFAGFARTFYLRSISGAPPLSLLLIVHGIVMTAWFVVFGAQVWLVSAGRTGLHRRLGVAGLVVAVLVVCVGVAAAIDAGRRGASPAPGVPPLMFMAIPLFDMPVFALLVAVALWQRRRPDILLRAGLAGGVRLHRRRHRQKPRAASRFRLGRRADCRDAAAAPARRRHAILDAVCALAGGLTTPAARRSGAADQADRTMLAAGSPCPAARPAIRMPGPRCAYPTRGCP